LKGRAKFARTLRVERLILIERTAATALGLTILLNLLWISLPMGGDAPGRATNVVALNFFRHTAFLLSHSAVGNSIDKMKNKVGTLLIANCRSQADPSDVTPSRKG
jgi:hypothetical protein